ncbi:MAG: hypothetical protein JWR83_1608 [Aeromicrobium sp.]|nr:hypothetical protein [Aeromicrobium sp.]
MPTHDLTPEQWEDLIDSGHSCDERCAGGRHAQDWIETDDEALTTALAPFGCGPVGRDGSFRGGPTTFQLWRRAAELLGLNDARSRSAADVAAIADKYLELLEEWKDEERAHNLILRAQYETARAVREAERRRFATLRRAEPRPDLRSPNRPTRIDVDPKAWEIVKRQAVLDGRKVAVAVGALLIDKTPPRRSHGSAHVERRFARLFVDDARWTELRALAVERGIPITRLVGIVIEREAKRLGWTPGVGR